MHHQEESIAVTSASILLVCQRETNFSFINIAECFCWRFGAVFLVCNICSSLPFPFPFPFTFFLFLPLYNIPFQCPLPSIPFLLFLSSPLPLSLSILPFSFCIQVRASNTWGAISPQQCQIDAWSLWTTHRNSAPGSQMVTWPMTSRDRKRSKAWHHYFWGAISS